MSDATYVQELQDYVDRLILSVKFKKVNESEVEAIERKIRSTKSVIDLYEKIGITPKINKNN